MSLTVAGFYFHCQQATNCYLSVHEEEKWKWIKTKALPLEQKQSTLPNIIFWLHNYDRRNFVL